MLQQLEAWRKEAADVPISQKLSSRGQSDSGTKKSPLKITLKSSPNIFFV